MKVLSLCILRGFLLTRSGISACAGSSSWTLTNQASFTRMMTWYRSMRCSTALAIGAWRLNTEIVRIGHALLGLCEGLQEQGSAFDCQADLNSADEIRPKGRERTVCCRRRDGCGVVSCKYVTEAHHLVLQQGRDDVKLGRGISKTWLGCQDGSAVEGRTSQACHARPTVASSIHPSP